MGSEDALIFVDNRAVKEFELRAPGLSHCDDAHVSLAVQNNTVLKGLTDESARVQVVRQLGSIDYLIPSLCTLQWDYYYLKQWSSVMRALILGQHSSPITTRTLASNAFTSLGESLFSDFDSEFLTSYNTLSLHIMQNIVELSEENPLLEDGERKPEARQYDVGAWCQLALRAREL
jgi:hypothetical protein